MSALKSVLFETTQHAIPLLSCKGLLITIVEILHMPDISIVMCIMNICVCMCLFVFEAERPSQQFFSHVGREPALPGFNQYCRE